MLNSNDKRSLKHSVDKFVSDSEFLKGLAQIQTITKDTGLRFMFKGIVSRDWGGLLKVSVMLSGQPLFK
jgi:hypothetical protein